MIIDRGIVALIFLSFWVENSWSFQSQLAWGILPNTKLGQCGHHSILRKEESGSSLNMAGGMGMGSSSTTKKRKKGNAKNNKKKSNAGPFDVSAAYLKSEKLYEELSNNLAKEMNSDNENSDTITSEYMVAARLDPKLKSTPPAGSNSIFDWVPISQLCLVRPLSDPTYSGESSSKGDERVRMAVSALCRELNFSGALGAPILNSIPRNMIQYSVEPLDSFYRYVYEDVIEGKNTAAGSEATMSKSEARKILKVEEDCNDVATIKKAYRSQTFELHPDRFIGVDQTDEEKKEASDNLAAVKLAYETLNSGVRNDSKSWYESLGGKSRTELYGPIELMSVNSAKELLTNEYKYAVASVDPEIIMSFIARNQAAARILSKN